MKPTSYTALFFLGVVALALPGCGEVKKEPPPKQALTLSEINNMRKQIAYCWTLPATPPDVLNLPIELRIQLKPNGSVMKIALAADSKTLYQTNAAFKAVVDSAVGAIQHCSPIKNLPLEKYEEWRDMELTFDPKDMLL